MQPKKMSNELSGKKKGFGGTGKETILANQLFIFTFHQEWVRGSQKNGGWRSKKTEPMGTFLKRMCHNKQVKQIQSMSERGTLKKITQTTNTNKTVRLSRTVKLKKGGGKIRDECKHPRIVQQSYEGGLSWCKENRVQNKRNQGLAMLHSKELSLWVYLGGMGWECWKRWSVSAVSEKHVYRIKNNDASQDEDKGVGGNGGGINIKFIHCIQHKEGRVVGRREMKILHLIIVMVGEMARWGVK